MWVRKTRELAVGVRCSISPLQVRRRAPLQTGQSVVDDRNLTAEELGFIRITRVLQLLHNMLLQTKVVLTHGVDVMKNRLQIKVQKQQSNENAEESIQSSRRSSQKD